VDEGLNEFAWSHVNMCTSCGSQPGRSKTIFGKDFNSVCTSEVAFWNPNADALNKIIRMIDIWKESVDTR